MTEYLVSFSLNGVEIRTAIRTELVLKGHIIDAAITKIVYDSELAEFNIVKMLQGAIIEVDEI